MEKRRSVARPWFVLIAVAVVVLLVAGYVFATRDRQGPAGDLEGPVKAMFTAFASMDGQELRNTGACAHLCVAGENGVNGVGKEYNPPTDLKVTGEERTSDGASAVVGVTYRLGGNRYHDTVGLRRSQGSSDRWLITNPPGAFVTLVSPADQVRIADLTIQPGTETRPETGVSTGVGSLMVRTPEIETPGTVWAPPGDYLITVEATLLRAGTRQSLTIAGSADAGPSVSQVAASGIIERPHRYVTVPVATEQRILGDANLGVKKFLDLCASTSRISRPTVTLAEGFVTTCPFSETDGVHDDRVKCPECSQNVKWTIAKYPEITLSQPEPKQRYAKVDTSVPGTATVAYDWADKDSLLSPPIRWQRITHQFEFAVGGLVYQRPTDGRIIYCAGSTWTSTSIYHQEPGEGCVTQ